MGRKERIFRARLLVSIFKQPKVEKESEIGPTYDERRKRGSEPPYQKTNPYISPSLSFSICGFFNLFRPLFRSSEFCESQRGPLSFAIRRIPRRLSSSPFFNLLSTFWPCAPPFFILSLSLTLYFSFRTLMLFKPL